MQRIRLHRLARIAALSLPLMLSQDGGVSAQELAGASLNDGRVLRARDFVEGLGVNAHVSWPGQYPYSETERVVDAMEYLGVRNLRDHVNASTLPVFERLAARGIRFDLLLHPKIGLDDYIGWARRLARTNPGSVAALEGPNEVDKWPVEFQGLAGLPAAARTQKALYARAKADPALSKIPVYNVTVSGISRPKSSALGDLSAHADYANVHPYYRAGQQSWGHSQWDSRYTLKNYIASAQWTAPGRPVVLTETGSSTSPRSAIGVTEEVQAKQILNSLLSAARHGARATYIYELVDSHDGGPEDVESHYGLYRYDWTPKPAAHALHNLTRILGAGSSAPRPRYTAPSYPAPRYTVTGMPATGSSLLLLQEDGTYNIVLWAEPDLWDDDADRPIVARPAAAEVDLGSTHPSVAVYDPLVSDKPLQTHGPIRKVSVSISDHPLVLKLRAPRPPERQAAGRAEP